MDKRLELSDIMPMLGDAEVMRLAREHKLSLSVPVSVLDRLNTAPVEAEIAQAAREAVRSAVLFNIYAAASGVR